MDIEQELINEIITKQNKEFENIFRSALSEKGFDFENTLELYDFVQRHVSDFVDGNYHTYYIDGTPFLQFNFDVKINHDFEADKITAVFGEYKLL